MVTVNNKKVRDFNMRNSNQVFKYYTPWQVTRIEAKSHKDIKDKLQLMDDFLDGEPTVNNYLRVINWARGLWINKHLSEDDWLLVGNYIFFWETQMEDVDDFPDALTGVDAYPKDIMLKVFRDLKTRANKWAKNNYYNTQLLVYLQELANYLSQDISQLLEAAKSNTKKSTHKFIY